MNVSEASDGNPFKLLVAIFQDFYENLSGFKLFMKAFDDSDDFQVSDESLPGFGSFRRMIPNFGGTIVLLLIKAFDETCDERFKSFLCKLFKLVMVILQDF